MKTKQKKYKPRRIKFQRKQESKPKWDGPAGISTTHTDFAVLPNAVAQRVPSARFLSALVGDALDSLQPKPMEEQH